MLIGLTSDRYGKIPLDVVLRVLNWCGISFSEVTSNVFQRPRRALKNSRGMKLGLHLPNVGNMGYDFSSSDHRSEIRSTLGCIKRYAKLFSFEYAVFHPPEADKKPSSLNFLVQNLKYVDSPLVLENTQYLSRKEFLDLYKVMKIRLGSRLKGVCLDIPHAYLSGEDWISFYQDLATEVKVIHLSDCADNSDSHLPFGIRGDLILEEILNAIKALGFRGILNFEIKPPSIDKVDRVFHTYLQAKAVFDSRKMARLERRSRYVALVGKYGGYFLTGKRL